MFGQERRHLCFISLLDVKKFYSWLTPDYALTPIELLRHILDKHADLGEKDEHRITHNLCSALALDYSEDHVQGVIRNSKVWRDRRRSRVNAILGDTSNSPEEAGSMSETVCLRCQRASLEARFRAITR
jgi:hypothetical protein